MVGVRVVVSGRVQGVWFRQSCLERARAAGVSGWVRNRPDGTVEASIEGERTAVDDLLAWLAEGPPLAEVTGLEVTDQALTGAVGFEVR